MRRMNDEQAPSDGVIAPTSRDVLAYFFRLGFVNIGGPVAQLTMRHRRQPLRQQRGVRAWLSPGVERLVVEVASVVSAQRHDIR